MKKILFGVLAVYLIGELSAQTTMFNSTFYNVSIKDTSSVLGNVLYYLEVQDSLSVDASQLVDNHYAVEGGGWVSSYCVSEFPPTDGEVESKRNAYMEKVNPRGSTQSGNSVFVSPIGFTDTETNRSRVVSYIKYQVKKDYSEIGMDDPLTLRMMEEENLKAFQNLIHVANTSLLQRVIDTYCEIGMCNY